MQANSEISNLKKKLQEETTKNIQISKELRSLMAKEPTNQGNEYLVLLQDQLEEERKIRINLEQDYAISYKSVIEMESDIAAVRKLLDEEIKCNFVIISLILNNFSIIRS